MRRAGARKILFGSDGPWMHLGLELHKIKLLRLTPTARAQVLGSNILRLMSTASGGR
jgi:predicted TIM-barrel fold metal-dependent hydrolase